VPSTQIVREGQIRGRVQTYASAYLTDPSSVANQRIQRSAGANPSRR
jgi:hypothetical protein